MRYKRYNYSVTKKMHVQITPISPLANESIKRYKGVSKAFQRFFSTIVTPIWNTMLHPNNISNSVTIYYKGITSVTITALQRRCTYITVWRYIWTRRFKGVSTKGNLRSLRKNRHLGPLSAGWELKDNNTSELFELTDWLLVIYLIIFNFKYLVKWLKMSIFAYVFK